MSARHDPMDWRASKPGHKRPARRLPKAVRKALRDYRRNVIPMAKPRELIDSWAFLACFGIVVAALVWCVAQGYV